MTAAAPPAAISRTAALRAGWRNLAAATLGIGLGTASYAPVSSKFFVALKRDFGWSQEQASFALIALPITAVLLPLAGWLIDRFGVRRIAGISAALATVSYLGLARMTGSLPQFYVGFILLYVLGCATGPVAYTRLVAAQFDRHRGFALAVAQFGIALLAVLMPQLIDRMIGSYGWRGGYLFFAGVTAAGGLAAMLLMRPARAGAGPAASAGVGPRTSIASAPFWLLGLAVLSISAAAFGLNTHLDSVMADRRLGGGTATDLLSLFAGSVAISRLVVGRLLDTDRPARAAAGVMAVAAAGALLLLFGPTGIAVTAVAVILIGSSIGAELDLLSFFCARFFGIRHYAAIYGLLSTFFYIGIAIGGIGYGVIRTRTGSYDPALAGSAALLALATVLFLLLGRQAPLVDAKLPVSPSVDPLAEYTPA